MNRLKRLSSL